MILPLILKRTALTMALTAQPQFVTDTIKLLDDVLLWMIIGSIPLGVLVAGFFFVQWCLTDENGKKAAWKRLWTAVACCVGVSLVEGIIKLITSYYVH